MTKIEWTEKVWNPVTGCTKITAGCANCYAEVMARRLSAMPLSHDKYKNGFKVTLHPESLDEPRIWQKPSMVFVCSMGDLFHKDVPDDYIVKVMDVIESCPQHTFQILTKRAGRMQKFFEEYYPPMNVWLGVSCESNNPICYNRVESLRSIEDVSVKFLSCEPLLSDLSDINLEDIDWVITGGESGNSARQAQADWFRRLRDKCIQSNTPFFFKQWGAWGPDGAKRSKYKNGALLDGREWKEMPRISNH